jgi:hypothetical protein
MCEANFRIFRHYGLCYIIINMAGIFFLVLGMRMLDVHYTERWYNCIDLSSYRFITVKLLLRGSFNK